MRAARSKAELDRGMRDLQAISQGVWTIIHHTPETMALALLLNKRRDRIDIATIRGVLNHIEADATAHGCIFCEVGFGIGRLPASFVIVRPSVDAMLVAAHARRARGTVPILAMGICAACEDLPDIQGRVLAKLDETILPGLRPLPPMHRPGHA